MVDSTRLDIGMGDVVPNEEVGGAGVRVCGYNRKRWLGQG